MRVRGLRRGGSDFRHIGLEHLDMADGTGRRAIARAHARRANHPHARPEFLRQFRQEMLGAGKRA